ncbi:MAG: hypothetical protein IT366_24415 [Candidatus Hydrogenedentes bacterium]|nr:hypothetical protein [Candidatus Hydrogenedentota bacterium]
MPIQPEPPTQLLIIAGIAGFVCIFLGLIHWGWTIWRGNITSIEEDEANRIPFDNYCALLDAAERFQHIADLAAQRATICRNTAEKMQRENNRDWKAKHRGAQLSQLVTKLPLGNALLKSSALPPNPPPKLSDTFKYDNRSQKKRCAVCDKLFLPYEPVRIDIQSSQLYHDKCALQFIESQNSDS